jgi:hypothetical protein
MKQQAENALRTALNQVDRERRRATIMLFALLALTLFFWIAMIFPKDDHAGLPLGLAAMMVSKASHDNTRTNP